MKYHIITYGCQMNKSDSERVAAALEKTGYQKAASEKTADLFVLNACSVRQTAVDRIYGKINQLRISARGAAPAFASEAVGRGSAFGGKNKELRIILTGCVLPKDKKKLKDKVDLIFDINDLFKLPSFLKKFKNPKYQIPDTKYQIPADDYFKIKPRYAAGKIAYVPIMTGCDNFCSYCAVPYTRGREKSRPAEDIVAEIKTLVKNGYKEIILLGQNVNSYATKIKNQKSPPKADPPRAEKIKTTNQNSKLINFPTLLKMINGIPGDFKISFITAHPKDMTDETVKALKLPKIADYLHLPVQSGSNRILKLMNRNYTAGHYLKLFKKIRLARPDIKIGTDIIVGFPTETEKDFQKTVELCEKAGFDKAYIAQYSPRAGTLAAKIFRDNVPPGEKKKRWIALNKLINEKIR